MAALALLGVGDCGVTGNWGAVPVEIVEQISQMAVRQGVNRR